MPSAAALSTFAAVGLSVALAYFLGAWLGAGVALVTGSGRRARLGLRHQAGAFICVEIDSVTRRLRRHLTTVVIFLACFAVLVALGRADAGTGLPRWVPPAVALLVTVTATFSATKCIQLERYRRRLRALLAADLEVDQRLDEVRLRGHRVFHAVPVGDRVIDHVIVGANGVFAAQVMLPRRKGAESVSMARGTLVFGPNHGESTLQPATEAFARLAKDLGRLVGHPVKVVRTLIVPGCRVAGRDDSNYLLTNSQNCVTLVGWKDSQAYLMDDEVVRIAEWLSARCQPQGQLGWRVPRRALDLRVARPSLV